MVLCPGPLMSYHGPAGHGSVQDMAYGSAELTLGFRLYPALQAKIPVRLPMRALERAVAVCGRAALVECHQSTSSRQPQQTKLNLRTKIA